MYGGFRNQTFLKKSKINIDKITNSCCVEYLKSNKKLKCMLHLNWVDSLVKC